MANSCLSKKILFICKGKHLVISYIERNRLLLKQLDGDQIGRIFAQWAIVYYWQFFENYIFVLFFISIDYVLILK
jgi:hypothetical protein